MIPGFASRPGSPAKIGGRGGDRVRIGDTAIPVDQFSRHFGRHGGYRGHHHDPYRRGGFSNWGAFGTGFGLGVASSNWNRFWYDAYLPRYHRSWYLGTWGWPGVGFGYTPWLYSYSNWGYSPLAYRMGYVRYVNPYFLSVRPTVVYDYRQPIIVERRVVEEVNVDQALDLLDGALQAFYAADYGQAIGLLEESLQIDPHDPAAHELRALAMFATGQYNEAAATLNALLAASPGWDWPTMRGLYPSTAIYTQQLRGLEAYRNSNPTSADARFVLAYHYLVAGHLDAAEWELERVTELEPRDEVAATILGSLRSEAEVLERPMPSADDRGAPSALLPPRQSLEQPSGADAETPPEAGPIVSLPGRWHAEPEPGVSISLELSDESRFIWNVTRDGQTETVEGDYSVNGPVLILEDSDGGAMLARLTPGGENQFRFVLIGSPDTDPGLQFERKP